MLPGRVERIIPQADVRSRTFPIRIRLDESIHPKSHHIMAGMLGHVVLLAAEFPGRHADPQGRAGVWTGTSNRWSSWSGSNNPTANGALGLARVVPVELGLSRGSSIQIRGDVQVGDLVVTRGNERLRPNQPLGLEDACRLRPATPAEPANPVQSLSSR